MKFVTTTDFAKYDKGRSATAPELPEDMALPTQWIDISKGEDNAVIRYWDGIGWVRADGKCESQGDYHCCDMQIRSN